MQTTKYLSSFLCIIWILRNGLLLNSVHMIYILNMQMVHVIFRYILVGLQKGRATFKGVLHCWLYEA